MYSVCNPNKYYLKTFEVEKETRSTLRVIQFEIKQEKNKAAKMCMFFFICSIWN